MVVGFEGVYKLCERRLRSLITLPSYYKSPESPCMSWSAVNVESIFTIYLGAQIL